MGRYPLSVIMAGVLLANVLALPVSGAGSPVRTEAPPITNISTTPQPTEQTTAPQYQQPPTAIQTPVNQPVQPKTHLLPMQQQRVPSIMSGQPVPSLTQQSEEQMKNLVVPAGSILNIALDQSLSSDDNREGDPVQAVVVEPLYLGPYLVVPQGSRVGGKITHINSRHGKSDSHPYIVVSFTALKRPEDKDFLPFKGMMIAYKTGLRSHDYVWKLPEKEKRSRSRIRSTMIGALSGVLINPIYGPAIGAGSALLKSTVIDQIGRGGEVQIKANQPLPIAIEESFTAPVTETAAAGNPVVASPQMQTRTQVIPHASQGQPVSPQTEEAPVAHPLSEHQSEDDRESEQ
jgi:hypothetical protein